MPLNKDLLDFTIIYPTIQAVPLSNTGITTAPPPVGAVPKVGAKASFTQDLRPFVPAVGKVATV
jgi:hypothetical protein